MKERRKYKTYLSTLAAKQMAINGHAKGQNLVFCKIDGKEFSIRFINVNNKTFAANLKKGDYGNLFVFEKFPEIEYEQFFYWKCPSLTSKNF